MEMFNMGFISSELRKPEVSDLCAVKGECPVSREECLRMWDGTYKEMIMPEKISTNDFGINSANEIMSCLDAKENLKEYSQDNTEAPTEFESDAPYSLENDLSELTKDGYDPESEVLRNAFKPSFFNEIGAKLDNLRAYVPTEERISHTPVSYWSGERGNSKCWVPNELADKYLSANGIENITYKNGNPDFTNFAVAEVKIENMWSERGGILGNFNQAFEKIAEQYKTTPEAVAKWAKANKYTIHECPDKCTCQLIPSIINSVYTHVGGVSECKRRDT